MLHPYSIVVIELLYSLERILSQPLPQACIVAGIGMVLSLHRRHFAGMTTLIVASTWLYLCATPGFIDVMRNGLESQYPSQATNSLPIADAIVIFGGDGTPRANIDWRNDIMQLNRNRLGYGYQLYKDRRAPLVIVSDGRGGGIRMIQTLEKEGLSKSALRVEDMADTTYQNALYVSQILRRERVESVLLVTSPFHMPRALAALRKQGIHVIPASCAPPLQKNITMRWLPRYSALERSRIYLHEYIGLWVYKLRGWA